MLSDIAPITQVFANVGSIVVAIFAVWIAFREQLEQSREIARANLKPLLSIYSQVDATLKSVMLANRGVGAAVITRIEFSKGNEKTQNLAEFFQLGGSFHWGSFRKFPPGEVQYLGGGDVANGINSRRRRCKS